jgi:hypothetical protein
MELMLKLDQRRGTVSKKQRSFSSVGGISTGRSRRGLLTIYLQPQMEKYRCPWGKSSSNHNI